MLSQMARFPSVLWLDNIVLYISLSHIFFIRSSIDGQLGCPHILDIVNHAVINGGAYLFELVFLFFGKIPRNGIARSYDSSLFIFLRNLHSFP